MWRPKIVAAEAFSESHFAVAYGELDYDDPFTAVLEYEASFPQPWSRTDMAREIQSLTPVCDVSTRGARFVAPGDEGDVYFIGDATVQEKITGVGVRSPDATGAGAVLGLACAGHALYVVGRGEQVFRRTGAGRWDPVQVAVEPDARFDSAAFTKVVAASESDVYLLGYRAPKVATLDPVVEKRLLEAGDWDAWNKANADLAANSGLVGLVDSGQVHHFDGAAWRQLDLPGRAVIRDALIEAPDRVWLVCTGGTVLVGSATGGFRRVDLAGFSGTFLSITQFSDAHVLASDYALHSFGGRQLTPLKPRLRRTPNPFKAQGFGGTLLYFDYNTSGRGF